MLPSNAARRRSDGLAFGRLLVGALEWGTHAALEGGVQRVGSTRERVDPALNEAEKYIEEQYQKLQTWREAFKKKHGREAMKADILMSDKETVKLARRLGAFD